MVERDVQRVFGRRREFCLETETITALFRALSFDAQIFLEQPDNIRCEAALGEDFFPLVERSGQCGTIEHGGGTHGGELWLFLNQSANNLMPCANFICGL